MNPTVFDDLNTDAITGARMMELLGVSTLDLRDSSRFRRFQEVISFLKQYPEDTQNFLIHRISTDKPGVDKLSKAWEYSQLLTKKQTFEGQLDSLRKEGSALGVVDPKSILWVSHAEKELSIRKSLQSIEKEVSLYEK